MRRIFFVLLFMLVGFASFSYAEKSSNEFQKIVKEAVILGAQTLKIPGVDHNTEMSINALANTQKKIAENSQSVLHKYVVSDVTFDHKEWGKFAVAMYLDITNDNGNQQFTSEYSFALLDKKMGVDDYKEALKKFVIKANHQAGKATTSGAEVVGSDAKAATSGTEAAGSDVKAAASETEAVGSDAKAAASDMQ